MSEQSIQDMLSLQDNPYTQDDSPVARRDLSDDTVIQTLLDKEIFDIVTTKSEKLTNGVKQGKEHLFSFENMAQDLFASIYKKEPEFYNSEDLSETGKINSQIMGQVFNNERLSELREFCNGSLLHSGIALGNTMPELIEVIMKMEKEEKDSVDKFNDINNMEQQLKILQQLINRTQDKNKQQKAQQKQQQIQQQIQQTAQNIDKAAMQRIQNQVGQGMGNAVHKATKQAQQDKDSLKGWGLEDTFNPDRVPLEEKRYAIEKIRGSAKIKKFTDSVGKMRFLAKAAFKKKQEHIKIEIDGIKTGSNLQNLLPQEVMKLANPTLKMLFYKDFLEDNLLEYEKTYTEESGKGPIVCNLDESGSMQGKPEIWSKAVVVGLLEIAQLQKRDFCLCSFGSSVVRQYEFPKGKVDTKTLFEIIEVFANGGGTAFEPPLRWSMKKIKENRIFRKADIVFITDGQSYNNENFLKEFKSFKEKNEVTCFGIMIGGVPSEALIRISDKVVNVNNFLKSDNMVSNLFDGVISTK